MMQAGTVVCALASQCRPVRKAGRRISGLSEYDRQHLADRRIVVDNEYFAGGRSDLSHHQTILCGCGLPEIAWAVSIPTRAF
jgi:hypothetical protein